MHLGGADEIYVLGGVQAFESLRGDAKKIFCPQRFVSLHGSPQRRAFDVLHDEEQFAVLFDDVVNSGHVRMIERGGLLGFAQKAAVVALILLESRRHSLDSDDPLKLGVLRLIYLAHAAGAEQLQNGKSAGDGTGKGGGARRRFGCFHIPGQRSAAILLPGSSLLIPSSSCTIL